MIDIRWRTMIATIVICYAAGQAVAESTPAQDALVGSCFSFWDQDSRVTPANVQRLYAQEIVYYGHLMTRDSLYRDKLSFIRRWPARRYSVEPGSAVRHCNEGESTCVFTATLDWQTQGRIGTKTGRSRVSLTLAREDGVLKIVREGGVTLQR